jgi:hypothetical protein
MASDNMLENEVLTEETFGIVGEPSHDIQRNASDRGRENMEVAWGSTSLHGFTDADWKVGEDLQQ